jgi:hypothetical protein
MKKLSIVFACVAALSLVGCKKKDGAAGGGATCDSLSGLAVKQGAPKAMADAVTKACKDDKWGADALKCFADAKDKAASMACMAKLTPEQNANYGKAAAAAMGMGDMGDLGKLVGDAMKGLGSAAAALGSAATPAAGSGEPAPTAVPADGSAAAPAADGSAAAPAADGSAAAPAADGSAAAPATK